MRQSLMMYKTRINFSKILLYLDRRNCNYNLNKYSSVNFSHLSNNKLSELPKTEVDNLCTILHKEWPQSIQAVNYLRTCSEWKKKKPSLDISMHYNEKNIQSGLFMLIVKSGSWAPMLTMYALDSYEKELEDVFSNFLDNSEGIVTLSLISEKHFPIMEKVIQAKSYKILSHLNFITVSMDIEEAKNLKIEYPSDVDVKPLRKKNLKEIYERWAFQDTHNMEEVENSFELNNEFAWGVFCKKTGLLLCNCIRSHNGAVAALQTIQEARGKGYAELLSKHVAKKLAEHSVVPYTFVLFQNYYGRRIHVSHKVGYRRVGCVKTFNIGKCAA